MNKFKSASMLSKNLQALSALNSHWGFVCPPSNFSMDSTRGICLKMLLASHICTYFNRR